jgi:hypothetical protein
LGSPTLIFSERRDVDLHIEVTGVGNDRAVFHHFEMMLVDHVEVACHGAEDVADLGGFGHRHDLEAVHDRFERLHRVDLGDDDLSAHAARAGGETTSAPAVASHDEVLASQQHVGGADDAVHGGLARAVAVVEQSAWSAHRSRR